jgi:hypothetical protein
MHAIISLVDRNKALLNNKSFISQHTKTNQKFGLMDARKHV